MKAILILTLALGLAGCSIPQRMVPLVQGDLKIAIARGEKHLGAEDPLVKCYKALDKAIETHRDLADFGENGLLLDMAMRARILQKVSKDIESQVKGECSAIAGEVLIEAARKGIASRIGN